jgi:hypothetical protein
MNKNTAELADRLKKNWTGPMSEKEVAFLRDLQGFIDFAVQNGLNFSMVMSGLGHDVNEIFRHGLSLDKALSSGFRPQVTGYRDLTSDSFGDSPEDETPDK